MANEEDDPIIQEIDVYLAKSLAEKLYLFQYPIRPASMTYDDVMHLSAKIKPKQQKVELEMAIDTVSPNYCRSKGEQIALNVDGTCTDESSTYSSKLMDKQTFSSIQAASNTSRYAAAIYRKGELHLTPLHGILQLRPSFSYLDKADAKHREREAANEAGDSSQDEAEEDVKQITVRFSRPESEQARQRRVQSYEFLQKKQAEEPWVHLHYYSMKDSRSEHERQYLFCQSSGMAESTELVKSPSEYLTMLMPPSVEEEKEKPVAPSNVLSMAQLRTLPLADQIRILMRNVKVMPFSNLMGLVAAGTDSTAVLRCIQQVSLLVQGNWVVKSDILYPKDTSSPHSGVPAEVLCRGRDFVMWKFTRSRWVVRKEIATVTKLCPEDVKEFLEHVSMARINRGWEFLLPFDEEFVKKHPDVVQRQHMLWMGIQAKLEKVFNLSKEDTMPKKPEAQSVQPSFVSGEQRVNMARAKAKENCPSLARELQKQKAQNQPGLASPRAELANVRIKEEPVSDEEAMDTSPCDALNNGIVNGIHSSESSLDSLNGHLPRGALEASVAQELKAFVTATFRKHYVLTLSELKRFFNLHLASLPPGHKLFSGISDKALQETVLDVGCKQILVPFSPQSTAAPDEQKVFALWECGDTYDQHRQVLLEIFSKNYRVRRSVIQTRLIEESRKELSKQLVDKVLKDCCVSYGGMWYLKGTVQS
ncbi:DNA-directed RNA polymerase III subunit RPC5 [Rhinatrema bivittatum]|uniref:DNA-directed RNA polymerase III subunit RPC5 n=1 Tax=Rhinatrema bivittatum TaxID=194408 RepID=UPI00112DE009|nr:DNA-directed RNA polymerase III subunit RPC5 [Rhinatrema bivittatum]XP_029433548.1 DNA-directed RNA polymerase III subunit RPC5 [Rhinatrema bivittatum]XP_029433549.1 DNA-directed RNA polymerase III subunit RPC5 [Rhinatrema bivittatum]